MNSVAQSRRRRLAHYLNPTGVALAPEDEIDVEDSKTELFGKDADRILQDKEKATELDRIHSGIKPKRRHALPISNPTGRRGASITIKSPPKNYK